MANKKLSDAVEEYGNWARTNFGASTWRSYLVTLEKFLVETGNVWVKNLTERHTDSFFTAVQANGLKVSTLGNYVVHLKSFADWCRRRKYAPMGWDPIGYRRRQTAVPDARYYLPQSRFNDLLDVARNPRDRMTMAVGLYLLTRQSEALAITVNDVDLPGGWVNIEILKTRARDVMPISSELADELRTWMPIYAASAGPLRSEWKLLPTRERFGAGRDPVTGQLLPVPEGDLRLIPDRSPTRIDIFIKKALADIGAPTEGTGMHTLRRSGARARFEVLAASGYDGAVRQVQSLLHHKNTNTTEHYIGLTLDVMRRDEAVRGNPMYPDLPGGKSTPVPVHVRPRLEIVR